MKKVSFVIPSHNSACWLAHAIASCQEQTYANIEIVVVDDASTDSTPELLSFLAAKDKRIKAVRNEKNLGRSASRNRGNALATGDYILVLDADDLAYKDRARLTVEKFKKADIVYGGMDVIDALGLKKGELLAEEFNREKAWKDKTFGIVHSSCAYTREVADKIKYEEGELSDLGADDFGFYATAAAQGLTFAHTAQIVGAYRLLAGSISQRRDEKNAEEVKTKFLEDLHQVSHR